MTDKVVTLKAVPTQAETAPQAEHDPVSLQLATETTAAIQRAMTTAGIVITTVKGRSLRKADINDLTTAGMSGWDCEIFRILGDAEHYSADFRGKAMKLWATRRAVVVEQARNMARAICGGGR